MDGMYIPDSRKESNASRRSDQSNPIRLGDSNMSEPIEEQK